ncbi:hypothetical protein V1264_023057 [Littorina saxatilis]|uniref:Lipase domain-containing protein n=2 Tax=Littorina saxatilis TaxID=31220 RepID=A0AAN9B7D5_9CAEN
METSIFTYLVICALSAAFSRGQHVVHSHNGCHGVYYDTLGCFPRTSPYNNTAQLPQTPHFVDTTFHLYTRSNPHHPQTLSTRDGSGDMGGSHLDTTLPIKVLVHGFLQNDHSPWIVELTHALLDHDNVNVITVDWGSGAGFPYTQAAANTRVAGAELARLISLLGEQKGVSARNIHMVGHSLGAHVAGNAGRILRGSLGRISGLDPADPNFSHQPTEVRLDPTDARWVDVIHTDGSPYTTYSGYGSLQAMGHIDFYPNGGKDQPGCHSDTSVYSFVKDAYRQGMTNAEDNMACSHDRSTLLFIQSVTSPCPFTAYPCASDDDFRAGRCMRCGNRPCPSMGYGADLYKRSGAFYLHTQSQAPFCGYHYLVKVTLATDMPETASGLFHVQVTGDHGHTSPMLLHTGALTPGQVVSAVMLAPEEIGHVTSVTLTLTENASYFGWMFNPSNVKVKGVMVEQIDRRHMLYFCPTQLEDTMQAGQPLELSGGTRNPGPCFRP